LIDPGVTFQVSGVRQKVCGIFENLGAGAFEEIVEPMRSEDFWVPGEALAREHARSGL